MITIIDIIVTIVGSFLIWWITEQLPMPTEPNERALKRAQRMHSEAKSARRII